LQIVPPDGVYEAAQQEVSMAIFDDEPRKVPVGHQIGQDLSSLSLHELDERIAALQDEIRRLEEAKARKAASMTAASTFFKS
jgi:uncharacterized small protein (DUF1192 family)